MQFTSSLSGLYFTKRLRHGHIHLQPQRNQESFLRMDFRKLQILINEILPNNKTTNKNNKQTNFTTQIKPTLNYHANFRVYGLLKNHLVVFCLKQWLKKAIYIRLLVVVFLYLS